jgi:hypothetical protein
MSSRSNSSTIHKKPDPKGVLLYSRNNLWWAGAGGIMGWLGSHQNLVGWWAGLVLPSRNEHLPHSE